MGYDTDVLRIISMNASGRKGRMYNDFRRDNLRNLVENERPDIMFLPGDNPSPNTFTQTSYQQLLDPTNNETVLLYDSTRLKIHQQPTDSQFKIPNCDLDKVLSPMVDICSPAPASQIVKKFVCVSWHWELTTIDRGSQEKNTDISFFVASKEMQLMETRHTKLESLAYRSAGLQLNTSTRVPTYCPEPTYTKTQMYIPPRPPKNHGG
uniref:Uncharacterized protein n=1 Tax=Magallana gigas TaxID=29159 RepID=A0A8W8LGI0_MAGGI